MGQFTVVSVLLKGASRIIAIDCHEDRLAMARRQGAFTVNFEKEDPIETISRFTGGMGTDCAIDAVGIDSQHAHAGPALKKAQENTDKFRGEVTEIAPHTQPQAGNWLPGDAPTQALEWAIHTLKKAGRLSIIGVYPPEAETFPIGKAMNKNLTIKMGNCNHHTIIHGLLEMVRMGAVDPAKVLKLNH